jgi:hypothetical protein
MKPLETEPFEKVQRIILGVDVGQARDYTALAGVEQVQAYGPEHETVARGLDFRSGKFVPVGEPEFRVRYLKRFDLGTYYPDQIEQIKALYIRLQKQQDGKRPRLIVDATGVGRPLFDDFRAAGLSPIGILIHGGDKVSYENQMYNVPKRDLAGVLQLLLQKHRIKISSDLSEAKQLKKELLGFTVSINPTTGHDSYAAESEKIHDDLVTAVAVACWYGESKRERVQSIKKGSLGL